MESLFVDFCAHKDDEAATLPESDEVEDLVETMEKQNHLEHDLKHGVVLELRLHLDKVQKHEQEELGAVDQVPFVLEVAQPLLSNLLPLKDKQEELSEEAESVEQVEEEGIVD